MARLGASTALVSCVRNENLGSYLISEVAKTGVDVSHVAIDPTEPISLVLVSRTTGTPDFIPYRMADRMILPEYLPDELLAQTRIFHTTCWPLSVSPASETVLDAAKGLPKWAFCSVWISITHHGFGEIKNTPKKY
ncbi:MAG: sugar/nucleoside kinase (ribokinase family) [Spirosomataceae bacterium]|jgi:fructokinase